MTLLVRYMYPIYAEVDLDEGEIIRVVVDDEAPSQAVEVVDGSFSPVPTQQRDAALAIVDSMTWPSWDYGW